MTISVWRYSHLALAVSSFLFIALAAITGTILCFEPISEKVAGYRAADFSTTTLAEAIPAGPAPKMRTDESDMRLV